MSSKNFPYKSSFYDKNLLWENVKNLDSITPEIVEVSPEWYFPGPNLTYQFQNLKNNETIGFVYDENSYDNINVLVDYYTEPVRMTANRKKCVSPLEYFNANYDTLLIEAKKYQDDNKLTPPLVTGDEIKLKYYLREAIYTHATECTTFKINVSKAIFKYFKSRIVLDPSAGWGDRIIGAAGADVRVYHGIDPNPDLQSGYTELIKDINTTLANVPNFKPGRFKLIKGDFLQMKITSNGYDTVFTSPPFFDYEIYNKSDPGQSVNQYPTLPEWIEHFLKPYLNKCGDALVINGYLILYIADTRDQYFEKMHKHITQVMKFTYIGCAAIISEQRFNRAAPLWCYRKV